MKRPPLSSMSLEELLAYEPDRASWLFYPYVSGGLWVLQGATAEERLTLSLQMAISASSGHNLFGGDDSEPRRVTFVPFGKDAAGIGHYMRALENRHEAKKLDFLTPRNNQEAFDFLNELEPGGLVILSGIELQSTDAKTAFGPKVFTDVMDIASKQLVIVDPGRPLKGLEDLDSPVAGVVTLKAGGDYPELQISGRSVSPSRLYFDDGGWKPMPLQGMSIDQEVILEYLKEKPEAVQLMEIAKGLGIPNNPTFQRRVLRMSKGANPLVRKVSQGKYTYPGQQLISGGSPDDSQDA